VSQNGEINETQAFLEALDRLPFGARLDAGQTARAKKYAYHFFFRRMIPLGFIRGVEGRFETEYDLGSASDLKPGRHPGLDRICEGILNKEPFIFDGERE